MTDDNVRQFPSKSGEPRSTRSTPVNLPDIGVMEAGSLGFDDMEAASNMRDWLQRACEAAGATMTGGGFGFGVADIVLELEGHKYFVTIKAI